MSGCRRRFALKRDANEGTIVEALRAHGWLVIPLNGAGVPDLLCVRRGRIVFLEVKAVKGGRMQAAQVELHAQLAAAGLTVAVVTTAAEALAAVDGQVVRTAADVPARPPKSPADVRALATPSYSKGRK